MVIACFVCMRVCVCVCVCVCSNAICVCAIKSMNFSCGVLLTAACAGMHEQSSHYDKGSTLTLKNTTAISYSYLISLCQI